VVQNVTESTQKLSIADYVASIQSSLTYGAGADTYFGVILGKNSTSDLSSMIDSYAAGGDWQNVLKWSAVCWKLGVERESAIRWALGNYTMVAGNTLPNTTSYLGDSGWSPEEKWSLYGYYFAVYYGENTTKWNITAAFNKFDTALNSSSSPIYLISNSYYSDGRFYEECASSIQCLIMFSELLGVSQAMDRALYWWNWTNTRLWTGSYYNYKADNTGLECEAGFFLKILSALKYYESNLVYWDREATALKMKTLGD